MSSQLAFRAGSAPHPPGTPAPTQKATRQHSMPAAINQLCMRTQQLCACVLCRRRCCVTQPSGGLASPSSSNKSTQRQHLQQQRRRQSCQGAAAATAAAAAPGAHAHACSKT